MVSVSDAGRRTLKCPYELKYQSDRITWEYNVNKRDITSYICIIQWIGITPIITLAIFILSIYIYIYTCSLLLYTSDAPCWNTCVRKKMKRKSQVIAITLTRADLNIMRPQIPVETMGHCDVTIASGWPMCRWRHNRPSVVNFEMISATGSGKMWIYLR